MQSDASLTTGIVVADADRLVLRPWPVLQRRRVLLRFYLGLVFVVLLCSLTLAQLLRPYLTYRRALGAALAISVVLFYQYTTQVTLIALRAAAGIYEERRNRVLRTRSRRTIARYTDLVAVRLRSRVNPNAVHPGASPTGAYLHFHVLIETPRKTRLFWYTRYPECALQIARTIAGFANVPLVDEEDVAAAAAKASRAAAAS